MTGENSNITIAIPTYNSERFISETIDSVLNQTIQIKKILIVDDNSSDATIDICNRLKVKCSDDLIEVFENNTNCGYQKNWNRCFELCNTRYLVILHHDDLLYYDTVEKQLKAFEIDNDLAIVGGKEDFIDINGKLIRTNCISRNIKYKKGEIYEFVRDTNSYIPCSSVMFDMGKIRVVGPFEEYLATDELYWPRILCQYSILILGDNLIRRRAHSKQGTHTQHQKGTSLALNSCLKQLEIANYEIVGDRREKTLEILNAKVIIQSAAKGIEFLFNFNPIGFKYLSLAFAQKPNILQVLQMSLLFIKSAIKFVLVIFKKNNR